MENRKAAIHVKNLDKVYKLYDKKRDRIKEAFGIGRKTSKLHYALKQVSLDIYPGETVGIIGTNGSGKSTILKIITGVLSPTAGEVQVNGRISALLELGAGFNMEYNGIENVYLNGTMMGFSEKEIEERLPKILEFADIGEYVYQPVKTYSSGMFVRLAFAVAINIDPEILIVDEALSVGDVFFQAKCYRKFEEFRRMGKTIVFVSHDLSSINKYCDRVFLLHKGTLLGQGEPKEMIDDFKRVLVGQYDLTKAKDSQTRENGQETVQNQEQLQLTLLKRSGHNEEIQEYGTREAVIEEFYVTDEGGTITNTILKGSTFTVHMEVTCHVDLPNPIFALSIKDIKGVEITGTNTMLERTFDEPLKAGEKKHITFTQRMILQGGEYLLSFGVTGYRRDEFQVYHRLYDAMNVTSVSSKDTVGYFDCESEVKVEDLS